MNYKRILWKFFTESVNEDPSFDDFLIDFSTWISDIKFPLPRNIPESSKIPQK